MICKCDLCPKQNKPACPFPGTKHGCGEYIYSHEKLKEACAKEVTST